MDNRGPLDDLVEQSNPIAHLEVERYLLGALLYRPQHIAEALERVQAEHFYDPLHNLIFQTLSDLYRHGRPADIVAVSSILQNYSMFEDAGGMKYLASLAASVVSGRAEVVSNYADIIADYALRRELADAARDIMDLCRAPLGEISGLQIMESHEVRLAKLASTADPTGGLISFDKALESTYDQWTRESTGARGVPTGYYDLDKLMGGLHPIDLITLAGASSMGKTSLAVSIAFNAARFFEKSEDVEYKGRQVAFFSLEMSKEQLVSRVITGETRIVSPRNRWGQRMDQQEWDRIVEMSATHGKLPFYIDDTSSQTVSRIKSRCVRLHRRKPIGLIVIDYIQLVGADSKQANEKDLERVSQVTRALKILAKDMKVPVIALSQLSRAPAGRESHRPQLADLRSSGTIENDSDIVLFAFREEYYLQQDGRPVRKTTETSDTYMNRITQWEKRMSEVESKCEVIVAKQRHGPLGSADLYFDKARTWFDNLDKRQPQPAPDGSPHDSLLTPEDHLPFGDT